MIIKILSNSTINKISAGEVIERPSSVVKELVENSIDAGSTKVEIILDEAGKNLISIKDNGRGMSKDELELAIQRHATSKLDEDDLLNINSFGFRGEALPSIGAISKFKIASRQKNADIAHTLSIIGGIIEPTIEANIKEGTNIEVRDLFFATPARLKFLRSDKTELSACILAIKKIALAHPHISFNLTHNGKELINVTADDNVDCNLKKRVIDLLGNEFIENAADVFLERNDITILGYSSIPTYNRAGADDQFLFINNRPVKDKILNIALRVAYQDYLARNRHPVSVLFISVNPHFVDVNVHPAKSEVRFHDPNLIRSLVINAIRDALNNSSNRVSNVASQAAMKYMQTPSISSNNYSQNFAEKTHNTNFSMPKSDLNNYSKNRSSISPNHYNEPPTPRIDYTLSQTALELIETSPQSRNILERAEENNERINFPLGAATTQVHGTYIVSQTKDSIIITDQHAAHERIGYENIKNKIAANGLIKQRLLIPEIIELPDSHRADLLFENRNILAKLGMTIERFGDRSIIISELPSLIGDINPSKLAHDLADYLSDMGGNIALDEIIEHVTETYACHYAIRAGRRLNIAEMNELLRQMENTPFSGQCNHGRQTYVELKLKDIEKLFGRK